MKTSSDNGINETKLVYICKECHTFKFFTRVIGDERITKTRKVYCPKCGTYTTMELEKDNALHM